MGTPVQGNGRSYWPTVGRDDECRRALAALDTAAEGGGVVLLGESGVGKSTLARLLADELQRRGATVRFALGTPSGRSVPLGAFSRAITAPADAEPTALLGAAYAALVGQPNPVVVVDDAQLLDPMSATLVHQLAADGAARLILTVQAGVEAADAVTALVKERWLSCLRIAPFTREQTAALATAVLGGAVDGRLVDELQHRTAGSPLLLRGLLSPGRDSGVLVATETGWRLHGALNPDRELQELLEFRLHSLSPDERAAIELAAVAELVDWQVLRELCDPAAVERLERLGLIQLIDDAPGTVVALNNPMIGEVALQLAGVVRTRTLNGMLAEKLAAHLARGGAGLRLPDVRGRIRMAQFWMRSDLPADPDVLIGAAEQAVALADVGAAAPLARHAFEHGGGTRAALVLAEALRWQGRCTAAEEVLQAAPPGADDPMRAAHWACLRAANLFEGCGEVAAARRVLADAAARLTDPRSAALLAATAVSFDFFGGAVPAAIAAGRTLCSRSVDPTATVWASAPTAWALALTGHGADVPTVLDAARAAAATGATGPQLMFAELAEAVVLATAGEFEAAVAVTRRPATPSPGMPEGEAIVAAVRGYVELQRGALPQAAAALRPAATTLTDGFQPTGVTWANCWLAQAEGARGDAAAATAALATAERVDGPQVTVLAPELELARAWTQAAAGQTTAARAHAVTAARLAESLGLVVMELRARHVAARFGDLEQAGRLAALAHRLGTPLPELVAAHARAVAGRDGAALDAVGDRFAALGALASATDAYAQAGCAHERAGERAAQLASRTRAQQLAERCGLASPALACTATPLPITGREREIAMLAAAGLSNRAIAERLGVSVRTIDGHLYRAFAKLDIVNRGQLAALLTGDDPAPQKLG